MGSASRIAGLLAPLALLAACVTAPADPQPVQPIPTRLQFGVSGHAAPVVDADGRGQVTLIRDGADAPITVSFQNDVPADFELAPGHYEITAIGLLTCRGMEFDVDGGAGGRHLGTLRAEIIKTRYYVAMIAGHPATVPAISEFADKTGIAPGNIDNGPISTTEAAPCFIHRAGPGQTWRDRPLGEKILLGIGFAGFCAIALASGGFCAF
jgi:hypothetical protein